MLMGYGREWSLPPLGPNEAYIDWRLALSLGAQANDTIYVRIPQYSFWPLFALPDGLDIWYTTRVAAVLASPMGKSAFTDTDPLIFVEYQHFLPSLARQLQTVFDMSAVGSADLYQYAQRVRHSRPLPVRSLCA